VEVALDVFPRVGHGRLGAALEPLRERLLGGRPAGVGDHVVGERRHARARQLHRRIQQGDAPHALRCRRQQMQRDHAAVGVADHVDALDVLGVERLEQIRDMALDRPRWIASVGGPSGEP
jgi:hypothetical protein